MKNEKDAILEGEALERLLSPYFVDGHKMDSPNVKSVKISNRRAEGVCNLKEFYISPTASGQFHVSVPNAIAFLVQVGIVHGHILEGLETKTGEIFMTDFSLQIQSMLPNPDLVNVRIDLMGRSIAAPRRGNAERRKRSRSFYKWKFSIEDGSWWGTMGLCFPF